MAEDGSESRPCIFIAPQRIQKKRHQMMQQAVKKKGFHISDSFSAEVTHVVTDLDTIDQAERLLKIEPIKKDLLFISSKWIASCLKAGKLVPILEEHLVKREEAVEPEENNTKAVFSIPEYACQRSNPQNHHNNIFTDALEILEKYADMRDEGSDYSRALAFRRGACTLKCLPWKVQRVKDVEHLPDIGGHVRRVIKEILDEGFCTEVEDIRNSENFKILKEFTGVYGVGPVTAKKWMNLGFRTIYDVIDSDETFDARVTDGLRYHHDLSALVSREEALYVEEMVRDEVEKLLPGVTVELVGGFKRGKSMGHDVDLLISHPDEGMEKGLLAQIISKLTAMNIILHGNLERSTFTEEKLSKMDDSKQTPKSTLDHFEKFIGIMRIPQIAESEQCHKRQKLESYVGKGASGIHLDNSERDWVARRVDLIIVPRKQYYYALLGWTGSRQFNRSMRLYALRELTMKLTSHGLYDYGKGESILANSEEEVFKNLKLEYRPPSERNA